MTGKHALTAVQTRLGSITPVSRETVERLELYRQLLTRWQARTNLVAPNTLAEFWTRHVADSLQLLSLATQSRLWIDLGSGGGFPGLVIAIASQQSESQHMLIESNHKKCAFLREVARQTGARSDVLNERIESATKRLGEEMTLEPIVTARALAPLSKLLDWSEPLLKRGGRAIFHKGRDYARELAECRGLWQFDMIKHPSRIEPDSVLLEIRNPIRRPV